MKPIVREWTVKAEADFVSAGRELRARKSPNFDDACFHAQQCAEKYIKAALQESSIGFARTHNLSILLDLLIGVDPVWENLRPQIRILNAYSVDFRYPGESADKQMAKEAFSACSIIRETVRKNLGFKS